MMLGMFLIIKLLVMRVLMKTSQSGLVYELPDDFKEDAARNCKLVASVISQVCIDYIDSQVNAPWPGAIVEI